MLSMMTICTLKLIGLDVTRLMNFCGGALHKVVGLAQCTMSVLYTNIGNDLALMDDEQVTGRRVNLSI